MEKVNLIVAKKISIILPNFNSEKYISATINSILYQSYKKWELILVDDCSNKMTIKILRKYYRNKKIKIFYLKKNKGAAYCRNLAIKKSKGDYLAFIDSDDLWKKNKLEKQLKFMEKNNLKFSYTNYLANFEDKSKVKEIPSPEEISFEKFTKNTSIATSTMMVKRELVKNIKFTPTKICEDYFYKCQILKRIGKAYGLQKNLTIYRVRNDSLQSNKIRNLFWIWKINSKYNKLSIIQNLISLVSISISSFKRYGFK